MESDYVDVEIKDEDELWRRVPLIYCLDFPGRDCRPHGGAFDDRDGELSVSVGRLTSVETMLRGNEGFAIAAFSAGLARECGFKVVRAASLDDVGHAIVVGEKKNPLRKRLAQGFRWVVCPTRLSK